MNDDLFIKRVPHVIKELIAREAAENHRSLNQEAIALLEEALLHRVESGHSGRRSALATLTHYASEGLAALRPQAAAMASHTNGNAATATASK